jgi:hypothetical protein
MHHRLLLLASALLVGCAPDPLTPPSSASRADNVVGAIVTSAYSYELQRTSVAWTGQIPFTFTNVSDRTISLLNCNGAYSLRLEKLVNGSWARAWSPVLPMCLSQPIRRTPGQTIAGDIGIFSGLPGSDVHPQFEVPEIEGTYRIVIDSGFWNYDHDGPPWGQVPPLEYRVSNSFEIRLPG